MYKIKRESVYLFSFIVFLAIISLLIIKSFIVQIIFSGILVYLFQPLYRRLIKVIPSHFIVSIFMIILILVVLLVPVGLVVWNFTNELSKLNSSSIDESLDYYSDQINYYLPTNVDLSKEYRSFLVIINDYLKNSIFLQVSKFVFNIFIIMFLFYYFLKNSKEENHYLYFVFKKRKVQEFSRKIGILIEGIVYGQMLVRFIQAVVGTFLFFLIGINGFVVLGFLMFFASFIPIVGTSLVWGPLLLINIVGGDYQTSFFILLSGILISTIDNFLLPYFISEKTNIGPVTTLISIIGGLQFFGFYGIILGPFFLGLLFVFIEELFMQFRDDNPQFKRYIWSREERQKYKNLKSKVAKEEFIRILNKKYSFRENKGEDISYRYEMTDSDN